MVAEGHEVPATTLLTSEMKQLAQMALKEGPPELSADDLGEYRYHISEILDDMREPRNKQELNASATLLHNELADFYFRTRRAWTGTGKNLVRRMKESRPGFCAPIQRSVRRNFHDGECSKSHSPIGGTLSPARGTSV